MNSADNNENSNWAWSFLVFAFAIVYPSTAIFKKVGWLPLLGYVVLSVVGLYLLMKYVLPVYGRLLNTSVSVGIMMAAILFLSVSMAFLFPLIQHSQGFNIYGIKFGVSDSNDAYNVTWKALFAGHYPYYEKSFLGNPISPMPGSLLLALPFYVLGSTVAQNIVWLAFFWIFLGKWYRDFRLASLLMLATLLFSPDIIYGLYQSSDYLTNSIYLLIPLIGILHSLKHRLSYKWALICSVMFGIGLSSRANFFLLVPILFWGMIRYSDFRTALKFMSISLATFALITLPFVLYDPAHFSPFHTAGKLDMGGHFPFLPQLIFLTGVILSFALGITLRSSDIIEQVLGRCYLVQILTVLSGFVIASIQIGKPNLEYPHFGVLAMLFGIVATGPKLFRHAFGKNIS